MSLLETLARMPWLHYWEQRLVGAGFYRRIKSFLQNEGIFSRKIKILEAGCGQGILASWFKNGAYVGIDTDFGSLKFASTRFPARHFLSANAAQVPFSEETFEVVLSVGVLHHLNDSDLSQHFREVLRVLKKGGKLMVFDSLRPEQNDFLRHWISTLERGQYLRTEEELRRQLSENRLPFSGLTRFRTPLLQNYALIIQKA